MSFYQQILDALKKDFSEAQIELQDTVGDDNHFHLKIQDVSLKGKNRLAQNRLINKSLKELYDQGLHALQIEIVDK